MKFKCIKGFKVAKYDEDGRLTEGTIEIEEGSVWEVKENANIIGGEVHLRNPEKLQWLEISKERLFDFFEMVR